MSSPTFGGGPVITSWSNQTAFGNANKASMMLIFPPAKNCTKADNTVVHPRTIFLRTTMCSSKQSEPISTGCHPDSTPHRPISHCSNRWSKPPSLTIGGCAASHPHLRQSYASTEVLSTRSHSSADRSRLFGIFVCRNQDVQKYVLAANRVGWLLV